jgi:hypothetical protein
VEEVEDLLKQFKIKYFLSFNTVLNIGHIIQSKAVIVLEGSLVNNKTREVVGERGDLLFGSSIFSTNTER